jgi:hypothetical protein
MQLETRGTNWSGCAMKRATVASASTSIERGYTAGAR